MRKEDAPPPGWYPDPTRRGQLRWWDGLDWTGHRRHPPPAQITDNRPRAETDDERVDTHQRGRVDRSAAAGSVTRDETAAIMAEVRKAARDEVNRAMGGISNRAREATRTLEPLIGEYGDWAMKWLRNVGIVIVVLILLWMVIQAGTQAALMDWIGDRVDNILGAASPD